MSQNRIWLIMAILATILLTGSAYGQSVNINFQPAGSEIPDGYLADTGVVFADQGNGFSYGWDRDITADTRDRGSNDDQRYDTLVHLQKATPPAVWEIALANGTYDILLVCGDPDNTNQTNTMNIEGTVVEDPDGEDNFDEYEVTIELTDGLLTITADADAGADNAKIAFVDIVQAKLPTQASDPSPADAATDTPRDMVLGWTAGDAAESHDVYLGTVLDDVSAASRSNPLGVLISQGQSRTSLDPGRFEFGQTYFWRVDEVLADGTIEAGDVWTFTVEPFAYAIEGIVATSNVASDSGVGPENAVNGSGLDENGLHSVETGDMWLAKTDDSEPVTIEFAFDRAYKLYEMLVWNYNVAFEPVLGFGLNDVTVEYSTDGVEWTLLDEVQFAQATGKADYAANTTVDFAGAAAQFVRFTVNSNFSGLAQYGLSEVRFLYIPVLPREPQPAAEATDVNVDSTLAWRRGREAGTHEVYLGTDADALALAGRVDESAFTPDALNYGTTYYWQIVEVNEAESISTWAGDVWSFATQEYAVVDDFESYTNDEGSRIYESWEDGWINETGSMVGYLDEPFAEQTIVKSGSQSMPLFYENDGVTMAEADFGVGQNWTVNGIQSLSLYFYGDPDNTGQLYVKINDTKVAYDGSASDITKARWQVWNIDLSKVDANLGNVSTLTIGIEGSGAEGVLYIDDIRLYPRTPEYIIPTEPDAANLLASYDFEGNANDGSGNGLNGSIVDGQLVSSGKLGAGEALQVDDAGYADLGSPASLDFATGDWTVTAWFKTGMTGTGDDNKGTIVGKGGDNSGGHRYALIMSETNEGAVTLVTDDNVTKVVVDSMTTTNDDEWHFVAGQREGTSIEIYIDGYLEGTGTAAADYDLSGTAQHNAYIGAITNNSDGSLYKFFIGLLDDVRFYNGALTDGEILWLAGATDPVAQPF